MRAPLLAFLSALAVLALGAGPARAGGGPETTLVVVNGRSPASLQVANHYVRLRGIPATHVCAIDGVPGTGTITVDQFRELIWAPIEAFLDEHGLAEDIDVIAYSADFPFGVNYDADFKGVQLPQGNQKFRVASLTGLTYLFRHVKAKSREYLGLVTNRYCRWEGDGGGARKALRDARGFRSRHAWDNDSLPEPASVGAGSPDRYYLAAMLGFTGVQGNSVPEIEAYLETAASADGKRPKGTVYLMEHKDVRAQTRMPYFDRTMKALRERKVKVKVLKQGENKQDGKVPIGCIDVAGAVCGIATFDWQSAGSRFVPGAIAEHLTSFGAKFDGSGQTKCSAFLRAGAVGTCGAVAEPYALWMKFPLPSLHVDYADGCCLAEAFYQNVAGPYQLLILGDPLARPYAKLAEVAFLGPDGKAPWSGTVEVASRTKPAAGTRVGAIELWIDGKRVAEGEPDAPLAFDTTTVADGHHELRVVAVEAGDIETRSSTVGWVRVANAGHEVTIKGPRKGVDLGAKVWISGRASKAKQVVLRQGHREIATARVSTGTWKTKVSTEALGVGTLALQAHAAWEDGARAVSAPFELTVEDPSGARTKKRRPSRKKKSAAKGKGKAGLEATVVDAAGKEHTFPIEMIGTLRGKGFLKRLKSMVKKKAAKITLRGEFLTAAAGLHQLAIDAAGALTLRVAGKTVFEAPALEAGVQHYVALVLEEGWHDIEVEYVPTSDGDLSLILGGAQVAAPLSGASIRH